MLENNAKPIDKYEIPKMLNRFGATELKKNLGKYMLLGQEEEIEVTNRGKVVFYITPQKIRLIDRVEKMFGCLPREAYDDDDIDRE